MNFIKRNYQKLLIGLYLGITAIINIIGYIKLPDKVATHMNFDGQQTNYIPTLLYVIISFALVGLLCFLSMNKVGEKKIKYLFTTAIIVIANISLIVIQMK